jgi:hypothetical protein
MAQVKKCPLCGGDVLGNYCFSCGIDLPDEEELSRRANPEPVRQQSTQNPESARSQNTQTPGAVMTEEASDYPRVKVADNGWHTSPGYTSPGYTPPPEQSGQYQQAGQYQQSGQAGRTSGFAAWAERYAAMGFGEKLRRYWWYILIMVFIPGLWLPTGIIGLVNVLSSSKAAQKFGGDHLLLALIALFVFM